MIEQNIRQYYQRLLVDPIAIKIKELIQPNTITILAGLFGILIIPALNSHNITLAIILLIASGYCDTLDGTIARFTNKSTDFGTILDIMTDRIVEFSVVLGLYLIDPIHRAIWCLLMLGSILLCISSFLVVGIFSENRSNKNFYYSPGIIERAEAFIFFTLMMLLPKFFTYISILFILLVSLTAIIRIYQFYKQNRYPTI